MKAYFAISIVTTLLLAQGLGFACSCAVGNPPLTSLDRRLLNEKTVYGTVVATAPWLFELEVIADYSRGGPAERDTIQFKSGRGTSCDVTYNTGTRLLVFGYVDSVSGQDTLYATHLCSGNVLNPSAAELDALANALAIRQPGVRRRLRGGPGLICEDGWVSGQGRRLDGKKFLRYRTRAR